MANREAGQTSWTKIGNVQPHDQTLYLVARLEETQKPDRMKDTPIAVSLAIGKQTVCRYLERGGRGRKGNHDVVRSWKIFLGTNATGGLRMT